MDDGDLLYRQMSTGGSISSLCFNWMDLTSTFEIHFDVVGGTGKFDGATGRTLLTGSASGVGTGIQSGIELEESGVVSLVE